jgi:hypothetical protein
MAISSAHTASATAPEPNSSRFTRLKSTGSDSPARTTSARDPLAWAAPRTRTHRSIPASPTPAGASRLPPAIREVTPKCPDCRQTGSYCVFRQKKRAEQTALPFSSLRLMKYDSDGRGSGSAAYLCHRASISGDGVLAAENDLALYLLCELEAARADFGGR